MRVRFRIDGALKDVLTLPAAMGLGLVSRIKIMAGMNIVERRRPQDGQLTIEIDGKDIDVRVSTVATIWGEKCVMRILDKTRSVLRLHDLGMPTDTHETFSKLVRAPFGMVLCAGPTGSGKTTTLYATLSEVDDPTRNIMTIEDPVEYVFPSINQIQTNEQAGLTFATGLKSILRQDPDVILVGEIRDVETARIAVQSALTGHFVLSSLHATDSVSALHRFLDMGIESFLIASSVLAVVGQRLVRRICPSCKAPYTPTQEELAFYEESGGPPKTDFYQGTGCNFCAGTGYQDRIGVYELLQITPEIKRLIVGWATQDELRRLAQKQGMRTLREEADRLWSPRTSRRSPKSSAASTPSKQERKTPWPSTATAQWTSPDRRSPASRRRTSPGAVHLALLERGYQTDQGLGEEERPPVRDHQEEGAAQGPHALLAPARRLRAGRHPDPRGPRGHHRGDDRQAASRRLSLDMIERAAGRRHLRLGGRRAPRGLPPLLRRHPLDRPS